MRESNRFRLLQSRSHPPQHVPHDQDGRAADAGLISIGFQLPQGAQQTPLLRRAGVLDQRGGGVCRQRAEQPCLDQRQALHAHVHHQRQALCSRCGQRRPVQVGLTRARVASDQQYAVRMLVQ